MGASSLATLGIFCFVSSRVLQRTTRSAAAIAGCAFLILHIALVLCLVGSMAFGAPAWFLLSNFLGCVGIMLYQLLRRSKADGVSQ